MSLEVINVNIIIASIEYHLKFVNKTSGFLGLDR